MSNTDLRRRILAHMMAIERQLLEAQACLDRLASHERRLAAADGRPRPRIIIDGAEVHDLPDQELLLADLMLATAPSEPIEILLHVPCSSCGGNHPRSVKLTLAGVDAQGTPILWDQWSSVRVGEN